MKSSKLTVPLTRFDGHLRCIRLEKLDQVQRETINFVCSGFFGRDILNAKGILTNAAAMQKTGISGKFASGGNEDPFAYRRFAGGSDLPRKRYYSVANDLSGEDGGALEGELSCYSDLQKAGPVWIRDTLNMDESALLYFWSLKRDEYAAFPEFYQDVLGRIVVHMDYRNTPISFDFADSMKIYTKARTTNRNEFAVFVPTQVESHQIENCIDLRLPATRDALIAQLDYGLPNMLTLGPDGEQVPLDVGKYIFNDSDLDNYAGEGSSEALFYGESTEWDGENASIPAGLPRLLSYLTYGQRGGSPITDAIGRWLRHEGVEALIFPSARTDLRVDLSGDTVLHQCGWNLVDFRGAPNPHSRLAIVCRPESWMNKMSSYALSQPPSNHELAGSFFLEGPRDALRAYLVKESELNDGV